MITIGIRMVRIVSPAYWIFAFVEIYSSSLRAQGSVLVTTVMTMTGVCILRVVWVLFIVPNGTMEQVIACYPITWVVTAIAMILYYFFKQRQIIERRSLNRQA